MYWGISMRLTHYLVASGSAALLAGTLAITAGGTATTAASPAQGHVRYSAGYISAAGNALTRYLRHYRPQLMLAGRPHAGPNAVTSIGSFNWSGYADGAKATKVGTFTKVSGSWTAPSVTCGAEDQIEVEWVGLDGLFTASVEQLGTLAWCYKGAPIYFTWWEMPTSNGLVKVGTTLKPGDKITASVTRSATNYTLQLTDATTKANSFTEHQTCATTKTGCPAISAEWVSERPAFGIGIPPLAKYNAFKITNGAQTASGKSGTIGSFSTVNAITMVDATDAYDLSTVSALTNNNSFSTTWQNSY
jgi:hypothetical protein